MGDVFKEQIVKKSFGKKEIAIMAMSVAGALALFIISSIIPVVNQFLVFVIFIEIYLLYFIFSRLNKEYEYIFTNGELDIDIIFNKSKRKHAFSVQVSDFELIAPVNDGAYVNTFKQAAVVLDFTGGVNKPNTYAALTVINGKKTKIIFEPDENMVKALSTAISPRKFIRTSLISRSDINA